MGFDSLRFFQFISLVIGICLPGCNLGPDRLPGKLGVGIQIRRDQVIELIRGGPTAVESRVGNGALHYAASQGNYQLVLWLLEQGWRCDSENKRGESPLHASTRSWYLENGNYCQVVEALLEAGAQIDARDYKGRTPLMNACELNPTIKTRRVGVPKLLLARGARLNLQDQFGWTALHHAVNLNFADVIGIPSQPYNIQVVRLLLSQGAEINAKSKNGQTVLDLAKDQHRNAEMLRFLESQGGQ